MSAAQQRWDSERGGWCVGCMCTFCLADVHWARRRRRWRREHREWQSFSCDVWEERPPQRSV